MGMLPCFYFFVSDLMASCATSLSLTVVAGAKKDEKTFVGARVIFFVIGGMTYSEVRSAYELTKSNNREVGPHIHALYFD